MFVDASALVAILTGEAERASLLRELDAAEAAITSALAVFETVAALSRRKAQSIADSESQVSELLAEARIGLVAISEGESRAAVAAFARFGKGLGHPAQLNMGECFAYACARTHDVPLLFVGDDFSRTDIRSALD